MYFPRLLELIIALFNNTEKLGQMKIINKSLAKPQAADNLSNLIKQSAENLK